MQNFSVRHALSFRNRGLVIARQNETCDKIIHLVRKAFSPHCVCKEPLIHLGHSRSEDEVRHGGTLTETWDGVSIRGLREIHTEVIIGVKFGYADTETWNTEGMDKILAQWEKINKNKHGQHC